VHVCVHVCVYVCVCVCVWVGVCVQTCREWYERLDDCVPCPSSTVSFQPVARQQDDIKAAPPPPAFQSQEASGSGDSTVKAWDTLQHSEGLGQHSEDLGLVVSASLSTSTQPLLGTSQAPEKDVGKIPLRKLCDLCRSKLKTMARNKSVSSTYQEEASSSSPFPTSSSSSSSSSSSPITKNSGSGGFVEVKQSENKARPPLKFFTTIISPPLSQDSVKWLSTWLGRSFREDGEQTNPPPPQLWAASPDRKEEDPSPQLVELEEELVRAALQDSMLEQSESARMSFIEDNVRAARDRQK